VSETNASKWINALESGEFQQAAGVLQDTQGRMCCLGVACELYRREVGGEWDDRDADDTVGVTFVTPDGSEQTSVMPEDVAEWLGFGDELNPPGAEDVSLAENNDAGYTFGQIADVIRDNYPEVLS
jgi:hypothetical protein